MSQHQIDMISSVLRPTDVMLEYGAGGSTAHFGKLVRRYISIEHDARWVNKLLEQGLPLSVEIRLCPPDNPVKLPVWVGQSHDFRSYIDCVTTLPYAHYDKVLIDGRVRVDCARRILPYLSQDSLVFVHDYFERPRYHSIYEHYTLVDADRKTPSLAVFRKS